MPDTDPSPDETNAALTDADVAHEGEIDIGEQSQIGAPDALGPLHTRFVRYPGCQQIILWLPQGGHLGYTKLRIEHADGRCLDQATVRERLNGSVQMLWDTLAWPPGDYRIVIEHADGWCHSLALRKRRPGDPAPPPAADAQVPVDKDFDKLVRDASGNIIYRDGFGRLMPNLDLEMHAQARAAALEQFTGRGEARLEYNGSYRGGTITYIEPPWRIEFSHEMGGGACKMFIDIPTAQRWEAATGTPLARRDEIVAFVALTVQREQCKGWNFEIRPDVIRFT